MPRAGISRDMAPEIPFLGIARSCTGRRWRGPGAAVERAALGLAQATGLPDIVARLLAANGVGAGDGRCLHGADAARADARPLDPRRHGPRGPAARRSRRAPPAHRRLRRLRRRRRCLDGAAASTGCARSGARRPSTSPTASTKATGRTCPPWPSSAGRTTSSSASTAARWRSARSRPPARQARTSSSSTTTCPGPSCRTRSSSTPTAPMTASGSANSAPPGWSSCCSSQRTG